MRLVFFIPCFLRPLSFFGYIFINQSRYLLVSKIVDLSPKFVSSNNTETVSWIIITNYLIIVIEWFHSVPMFEKYYKTCIYCRWIITSITCQKSLILFLWRNLGGYIYFQYARGNIIGAKDLFLITFHLVPWWSQY